MARPMMHCGSHMLHCQICNANLCPNANPKCTSSSTMLDMTDSVCECSRRCMRHSSSMCRAPQATQRTDNMKYFTEITNVRARFWLVNSKLDSALMIYFGVQYKCFMHAMSYSLLCKLYVCMFYVIFFGVQNECLLLPCLFAMLSYPCQHNYQDIVTCSNCLNCNWKWALALTLLNTIAQNLYPCLYTLVYSSPGRPPLLLVVLLYCPLVDWHSRLSAQFLEKII